MNDSGKMIRLVYEFDIGDILDDGRVSSEEAKVLYDAFDSTVRQAENEFVKRFGYRPPKEVTIVDRPKIKHIDIRKRNLTFVAITAPSVVASILGLIGVIP